ncbi:MAG: hypothetical protein LCH61_10065 [Proteobacteria bacterium]|nr:hypothetical protein [Pseudomonadota bacterium]
MPGHHQRYDLAADAFLSVLRRVALGLKYTDSQPRLPAGSPGGGQWTSGGAVDPSSGTGDSADIGGLPVQLAGGFDKEDMGKTVQEFVSEKCRGSIRSELPGQFWDTTISELLKANKRHDRAAQRCYKLLREDRFRKDD